MAKANGHKSRQNRRIVRSRPCLLCGRAPSDPHHWPVRVSHGATDDLYSMVPLCRECHDAYHRGDHGVAESLAIAGPLYYEQMRRIHGEL